MKEYANSLAVDATTWSEEIPFKNYHEIQSIQIAQHVRTKCTELRRIKTQMKLTAYNDPSMTHVNYRCQSNELVPRKQLNSDVTSSFKTN